MISFSENALTVLKQRYLQRDKDGNITETPEALFRRVAHAVSRAELKWTSKENSDNREDQFFTILSELLFLPNSPTLMNAGINTRQLSACFVLPVEDSMQDIFSTLKNAALIQQSGGGTGFNFSHLRPQNDPCTSSGGTASGPVAFMKIFDAATAHIKQGGKRRGANMGVLNIDHPDISAFINAKREMGILDNFNISVGITDHFMQTLEKRGEWSLLHPTTKKIVKKIKAINLWDEIVESAWLTGDPGLLFLDTINSKNPTPQLGNITSTNPCGEVPLLPYEPCNLGSINLARLVKPNNGRFEINWKQLKEVIHIAVRFLDNVIEINNYIIPEIQEMARANRKIGLGVMGWADLLTLLELPYDSEEAVQLAEHLMQFIQHEATESSGILAEERGVFHNWEKSIYYPGKALRNATLTSIAPTGTISIIADTSSSIEPLFALAYERQHVLDGHNLFYLNPHFLHYLNKYQLDTEENLQLLLQSGLAGSIQQLPPDGISIFKTSLEISPDWHLKHQLAFQKFTDNAVSKTINLPENASKNEVAEIYRLAWLQKAKGITIFRNNSKGKQVLQKGIRMKQQVCKVCLE